jgi:hypothetical protein
MKDEACCSLLASSKTDSRTDDVVANMDKTLHEPFNGQELRWALLFEQQDRKRVKPAAQHTS